MSERKLPVNPLNFNISKEDLSRFLNEIASQLESEPGKSSVPVPSVVVKSVNAEGNQESFIYNITADMNDAQAKNEAFRTIGRHLADDRKIPLMVCMVTSAWIVKEKQDKLSGLQPSRHPKRKDAIVVSALSINRICLMSYAELKKGRIESFSEPMGGESNLMEQIYLAYADRLQERIGDRGNA